VLCDLGEAKRLGGPKGVTSTLGVPYGPALYRAPEVIKGNPYTTKSDIYSFGCLIYLLMQHVLEFSESPTVPIKLWTLYEKCSHASAAERPDLLGVVWELDSLREELNAGTIKMINVSDLASVKQEQFSLVGRSLEGLLDQSVGVDLS
jgi:serine/threonine protein kinase